MKKFLLTTLMVFCVGIVSAQRTSYDVIAKVPYDARTEQYGKLEPVDLKIVSDGDKAIYIGAEKYDVVQVNLRVNEPQLQYVEYTAIDAGGEEYTIKLAYDGTAAHEVMRHFLLIFKDTDIYHWTYYYTRAGEVSK